MMSPRERTDSPVSQARSSAEGPALASWITDTGMRIVGRLGVGLTWVFGSRASGRLGILTYHRCTDHVPGAEPPHFNVTPERFREQVRGLLSRGFNIWPLSKVLRHRAEGQEVPPRTVVLTDDDGFQSFYDKCLPVLREYHVPATLFVSTAYLDSQGPFPFDPWGARYRDIAPPETYRPLTSAQCREMADEGLVELGAHTHTHADCRGAPEKFREDVQTSVDILRARFGLKEVTFAFPFGGPHRGFAGEELAEAARQTGVVCGLTTDCALFDLHSDPFHWGRFNVFPWDTSATLAAKLEGWYTWAARMKRAVFPFHRAYHVRVPKGRPSVAGTTAGAHP
jgi:peptidoglycan/xylan/chitin deacetylase (PgdA/CDA1 family)